MTTQPFDATEEELELATQILVSCGCNGDDGVLQGDQAKGVFNRSALPPATLHVIWNMSGEGGNDVLSRYEIAKALRLIGWVQAGEMLSEKLLSVAGPVPTLDGITNKEYDNSPWKEDSPQVAVFPPVNENQFREFKVAFWQADPVNGFLSEDKVMNAYMTSGLPYEDIRDIINLIDRNSRRVVDFTEFACGMYLVAALQTSQLRSLPDKVPPDLFDHFKEPARPVSSQPPPPPKYRPVSTHRQSYLALSPQPAGLSKPKLSRSPSPNRQPPSTRQRNIVQHDEEWEISPHDRNMFELYFRKLQEDNKGSLRREAFDEFVSVYRVPAADLERIWGLTTVDRDATMKREEFLIAMHLVKRRSAGEEIPASLPLSILPPSLKSRRHTLAASSLSQKLSIKKPPPPVPPKRRDSNSLIKSTSLSVTISPPSSTRNSVSVSPPLARPTLNPFRQPISPSFSRSLGPTPETPFDDPTPSQSLSANGIPPHSPPLSSPSAANHEEDRSKEEISILSQQIEALLTQLEAQNELRGANDALRLECDILRTQVKDMEKTMADILAVNEAESAASQEKYSQDMTRLMNDLGEKEAQCEDQNRRLRALTEDEKELRVKLRDSEAMMARHVNEAADQRQIIESQNQQISELNGRVADMSKVLADEPESNRRGTTSNREWRVLIRDVTRENDSLKSQVRDMNRSMEQHLMSTKHAKYDEMELENRRLKKSVSELEAMVSQLQTSLSSSSSVNHGRSSRPQTAETLTRENQHLKSQLQDGKRAFADFRSSSETKLVDLQQKLEALTQENNRLKLDIHDAGEGRREDGSVPPPAYDESFTGAE